MSTLAEVRLWGTRIGAVSLPDDSPVAAFEYDPDFLRSGIQVAPLTMPLMQRVYSFPTLPRNTFKGLPGLLADSLPDRFGNALINTWLASQGRAPESFNAVERLCYTGTRGMGALEFIPMTGPEPAGSESLEVKELVKIASRVLAQRESMNVDFNAGNKQQALQHILRVGTSAGGARAKAVIAWNPATNEVRSGQVPTPGFEYWLLKFDGVSGNRDKELTDPKGYGAVEYAYYLMATAAGITMAPCTLLEENGRRHFMTKRFDRTKEGGKLHMQSLCAMAHLDFNNPGVHSYEEAMLTIRRLGLPMSALEQQYRRMVFNLIARNQDDHVKNIAFLMDRRGTWRLSPAFDVTYAYNPRGEWTSRHQMSVNGKRRGFTTEDLTACAEATAIARSRVRAIHDEVKAAVSRWPQFAAEAKLDPRWADAISATHRSTL